MHKAGPDLIWFGTDPADQISRQTIADVDADDNCENTVKMHTDRTGQRLQNTDDSRRTLNNSGN